MGAKIKEAIPNAEVQLLKGGRGDFIVKADERELWNKKRMGDEFPEEEAIVSALKS